MMFICSFEDGFAVFLKALYCNLDLEITVNTILNIIFLYIAHPCFTFERLLTVRFSCLISSFEQDGIHDNCAV